MAASHRRIGDLVAASAILLLGAGVVLEGSRYTLGTPASMGPGFVPIALGAILMGLGAALLGYGWREPVKEVDGQVADERSHTRTLYRTSVVSVAIIAFALTIERLGIVPATLLLVLIGSRARDRIGWGTTLATAVGLLVFGIIVFIELLGIPIQISRW